MLKAIFFDMDGVIVDTERFGHRIAFNKAFDEFNLDIIWDDAIYRRLVQIGGGKERIASFLQELNFKGEQYLENPVSFVKAIHKRKTELFIELILKGELPLRPGVKRFMKEINRKNIFLGVCTTSNEKSAKTIIDSLLPDITIDLLIAGDMVTKKKPDPEIYISAIKKASITPEEGFVIEDTYIGITAAKQAGLYVVATVNAYTKEENVYSADIVVDSLGEKGSLKSELLGSSVPNNFKGYIDVELLERNMT